MNIKDLAATIVSKLPPDILSGPLPFPDRMDYAEKITRIELMVFMEGLAKEFEASAKCVEDDRSAPVSDAERLQAAHVWRAAAKQLRAVISMKTWYMHCEFQMPGAAMIQKERLRQLITEGHSPDHDDCHTRGELIRAAISYCWAAWTAQDVDNPPAWWPWDKSAWKAGVGKERMLVKAGALIAAEIDRIKRRNEQ